MIISVDRLALEKVLNHDFVDVWAGADMVHDSTKRYLFYIKYPNVFHNLMDIGSNLGVHSDVNRAVDQADSP